MDFHRLPQARAIVGREALLKAPIPASAIAIRALQRSFIFVAKVDAADVVRMPRPKNLLATAIAKSANRRTLESIQSGSPWG
jgi:hypothetical protein